MNPYYLLVPVLLPMVTGAAVLGLRPKERRKREMLVMGGILAASAVIGALVLNRPGQPLVLYRFGSRMNISLGLDGLSGVFACLIAVLWPLTALYSFEYMKHEGKENKFFGYFSITYGVVAGVALSHSLITLYFFYELMTLATLPLVMHAMDTRAMVFVSIISLHEYGTTLDFTWGGVIPQGLSHVERRHLYGAFILAFFGFGVKAAVVPFHSWLPAASVAPTPVSALLHAVAVVKGGVFALMRVVYWCFGAGFLIGTKVQAAVLCVCCITILYGSLRALCTQHLKRRLAYSTVSQLSYILMGVMLMTPAGLAAGLTHMVCHALMKITLFFCAGAILYKGGREYVYELRGVGRAMPVTMACFTLAGLGLVGVPLFAGFVSKFMLGSAAAEAGGLGMLGVACLIISAFFTLFYMVLIIGAAWFPAEGREDSHWNTHCDPNWNMKLPLIAITAMSMVLGLWSGPLIQVFNRIAAGGM